MASNGVRKQNKGTPSEALAVLFIIGFLLISLGTLSLLAVFGVFKASAFSFLRSVMYGLGGAMCPGVAILLVWGGLLSIRSADHVVSKRVFFLSLLIFLMVLAVINLLSGVGVSGFLNYCEEQNKYLAVPNPTSYWKMITRAYIVCGSKATFGGALGMLFAWPVWTYAGKIVGTIILFLLSVLCILIIFRFSFRKTLQNVKENSEQRRSERSQQREQREYAERLALEQRQNEERERRHLIPAFIRRNKEESPVQQSYPPQQQSYPSFQMGQAQQGGIQMPVMQTPTYASPQLQLYDETVFSQPGGYVWKMNPSQNRQQGQQTPAKQDVHMQNGEEQLSFFPGPSVNTGVTQDTALPEKPKEEPKDNNPQNATVSRRNRKAIEHLESNRRKKAKNELEISGTEAARRSTEQQRPDMVVESNRSQTEWQHSKSEALHEFSESDHDSFDESKLFSEKKKNESAPVKISTEAHGTRSAKQKPLASWVEEEQVSDLPHEEPSGEASVYVRAHSSSGEDFHEPERMPYEFPGFDLLAPPSASTVHDTRADDLENASKLEQTLESFSVPAEVQKVTHGPAVTRYELGLKASGIKVSRITSIADNIALDMASNGGVRIEIPIPGTNLFGVEIPNKTVRPVSFSEVLQSKEMAAAKSPLTVALGLDIAGNPVLCDLVKMPHLLIAGQTGSGKSVCINTIINSLIYRASPEEVRMIMVDPKVVELQCYNSIPHLLVPVVSDPHKAAGALQWTVAEMMDRYHKIQSKNVRDLAAYNQRLEPGEQKLPRIVIIIDELADLMMVCKKEIEDSIIRIAQLARAAGIHMVLATQRPTVNVITGSIKTNVPSRIAFAVASGTDSRTILDQNGAEKLLGRGDMLYYPTGASSPIRVQGCFMSDSEIERVTSFIADTSYPSFDQTITNALEHCQEEEDQDPGNLEEDGPLDSRLEEAIDIVFMDGQASISMLQRRMKIGYARAGRLSDTMSQLGVVSHSAGSKPREILMSREQWETQKETLLR